MRSLHFLPCEVGDPTGFAIFDIVEKWVSKKLLDSPALLLVLNEALLDEIIDAV